MPDVLNNNVAELIPFKNYKQKFIIVHRELMKGRYVEIWGKYVYSAKKWGKFKNS